ncbi:hypothetical protein [Ligilactobacillus equi]|uniref:Uncharacterized protein n=1 Tax=Ligilactobacillus equi DSM 15833 = JCM 10991 TaxID=1423740 RepID=A0A0R1TSY9_9LACO|nr:hypothetical protein [Ligilactobacillus equi]KRL84439.1 hypothetical protein FC36_GL000197 [Ligilactobacillus equi DSM 15833 = JCM 10991]
MTDEEFALQSMKMLSDNGVTHGEKYRKYFEKFTSNNFTKDDFEAWLFLRYWDGFNTGRERYFQDEMVRFRNPDLDFDISKAISWHLAGNLWSMIGEYDGCLWFWDESTPTHKDVAESFNERLLEAKEMDAD